jgi:GNAT superfamily N-acetyltransferase
VTALLDRARSVHPTAGLLEAADLQWWWRAPRSTDRVPQLFWSDDHGRPEAAVIATDWGGAVALDPIVMPDASPDRWARVVERALEHARDVGLRPVEVVIDRADRGMYALLTGHGFVVKHGEKLGVVDAWLPAGGRPTITPLPPGYRSCTRLDTMQGPHHLIERQGSAVEARLRQTSLYRPDLDLVVLDERDGVAAYGMFWHDPVTGTGLVEPMRTRAEHRRRGLARHVLTTGIERLTAVGARRLKVCFVPTNQAAWGLYLGAGFEVGKRTAVLSRSVTSDST